MTAGVDGMRAAADALTSLADQMRERAERADDPDAPVHVEARVVADDEQTSRRRRRRRHRDRTTPSTPAPAASC